MGTQFTIRLVHVALEDLRVRSKRDQQTLLSRLERLLSYEPSRETRNLRRLRPNRVAEWELRAGKFRVFYDVDDDSQLVLIRAIGIKEGNRLYIRKKGQEL